MAKTPSYDLNSSKDAQTCGIRHIGIGIYSSGKIREYLLKKGFSCEAVNEAVISLVKREYINDERAGRKVLLSRSGKKQESRSYLRQRLYAAGVSQEASDILLSEVEEDIELCFNLYLNLAPFVSDYEEAEAYSDELLKTARKRGFGYETSQNAYNRWFRKVTDDTKK
ncbi:MAG: RecX family transcriptional regulator [Clostridiales bacterium]|nr:RecX family transcriptional regulator [Clostridiales bacterium]